METRKKITENIAKLIGDRLGSGWGYSANQLHCAEEIYDKYIGTMITDLQKAVSLIKEGTEVINQNEKAVEQIIAQSHLLIKQVGERIKMAFYYEFDELIPSIMADKIDEIVKEFTDKKTE